MAIGRDARRRERSGPVGEKFGSRARAALDVLDLLDMAWHDCFGEPAPPDEVLDDVLLVSAGDLSRLISTALLAVTDWRDVRVAADRLRN